MKHYAGLDVGQQTTSICIVDEEGEIVAERKVATCPDAIAAALEPFTVMRAGLETGPLSVWLWNELKARKLATILHAMWKTGEAFRWSSGEQTMAA